jgi:hypothetical protein
MRTLVIEAPFKFVWLLMRGAFFFGGKTLALSFIGRPIFSSISASRELL